MAIDSTTASSVIDSARAKIASAIKQAADATGASFDYLISTAKIESNLNPSAQASTSSAKGLYQFIDQTWLGTMKQDGAALGLGRYADAITRAPNGRGASAKSGEFWKLPTRRSRKQGKAGHPVLQSKGFKAQTSKEMRGTACCTAP